MNNIKLKQYHVKGNTERKIKTVNNNIKYTIYNVLNSLPCQVFWTSANVSAIDVHCPCFICRFKIRTVQSE